jgi:predicted chitinase
MSAFKSDAQGFLIGDLIDTSKDMLTEQRRAAPVWREIRNDVKSIARAVGVQGATTTARRASPPLGNSARRAMAPAQTVARPAGRSGYVGSAGAAARSSSASGAARGTASVTTARDIHGRFIAGQKRDGGASAAKASGDSAIGANMSRLSAGVGRLADTLQATDNVDPTVNAAKELAGVARPIGRGLFSMMGRSAERKKERWYQRILKAVTGKSTKTGAGSVAVGAGSGTNLFGGLIAGIIPMLGKVLTSVLLPIAAIWGSFELGQWLGKKIYDWMVSSGLQEKLFGAVDAIKGAFTDAADWVKQRYEGAKNVASVAVEKLKAGAGAANEAIRGATGVDVAATAGKVADVAKNVASAAVPEPLKRASRAASNASTVLDAGRAAGLSGIELANFMGQNAHESGGFSQTTESLKYKPEQLLKTFKGRNGINTLADAQRLVAGGDDAVGNAIYGGDWGAKNLGNTEAGDGAKFKGRGFTQITGRSNYTAASKALGIDLVNNPELAADPTNAAAISTWYWKNRVQPRGAGEDTTLARKAINGGLNGLGDATKQTATWQARLAADPSLTAGIASVSPSSLPKMAMPNVPSSVPDKIPPAPEFRPLPTQLNSRSSQRENIVVTLPENAGQNISDRGLAHIVSGGLGGVSR